MNTQEAFEEIKAGNFNHSDMIKFIKGRSGLELNVLKNELKDFISNSKRDIVKYLVKNDREAGIAPHETISEDRQKMFKEIAESDVANLRRFQDLIDSILNTKKSQRGENSTRISVSKSKALEAIHDIAHRRSRDKRGTDKQKIIDALTLYHEGDLTGEEIGKRVNVPESTFSGWKQEFDEKVR